MITKVARLTAELADARDTIACRDARIIALEEAWLCADRMREMCQSANEALKLDRDVAREAARWCLARLGSANNREADLIWPRLRDGGET